MRYHHITKDDMVNGDGLRTVLWVAGCTHMCEDCQNAFTWDINGGIPFDEDARQEIFAELEEDYTSGITFSGGDPLHPDNREDVTALAKEIKEKYPDKTIWLYTGFLWDEVKNLPVMEYVDVVVDGPFVLSRLDNDLHWRGSSNQRVIDVVASREIGKVVLWTS